MLCIIIDYYFGIMYLKIDLSMNGLDVSVMSSRVMTYWKSVL